MLAARLSLALGLIGLTIIALALVPTAGCSSSDRATWSATHPVNEIAAHAAPILPAAAAAVTTGNPAPLAMSIFDFAKYLLTAGAGATGLAIANKRKTSRVLSSGQDRRGRGPRLNPPAPPIDAAAVEGG